MVLYTKIVKLYGFHHYLMTSNSEAIVYVNFLMPCEYIFQLYMEWNEKQTNKKQQTTNTQKQEQTR